jgi:hypothetical protein
VQTPHVQRGRGLDAAAGFRSGRGVDILRDL